MHAVFMLYGKKECVDIFIRDMSAQKHLLRLYKEGEKDKSLIIDSQVRLLPGGIYEYVFPKEDMEKVLTSLGFHMPTPYGFDKEVSVAGFKIKPMKYLKKFLKIEDIPEFKPIPCYPWFKPHVAIIPIGIRKDPEITDPKPSPMEGWSHEAI